MLIQVTLLSRLIPTVLAPVHCLLQLRLLVLSRVMLCPPVPEIVAETHPSFTLSFITAYILVAASPLARRTTYLCQQLLHAISVVILACKLLGNDHSQLLFPSLKLWSVSLRYLTLLLELTDKLFPSWLERLKSLSSLDALLQHLFSSVSILFVLLRRILLCYQGCLLSCQLFFQTCCCTLGPLCLLLCFNRHC